MNKYIIAIEYAASTKTYEYLFETEMTFEQVKLFDLAIVCKSDYILQTLASAKSSLADYRVVKIIEVKEITNQHYDGKLRNLVDLVSTTAYVAICERNNRKKQLARLLNEKAEQMDVVKRLSVLGELDEETKKMVDEYKSLL